jgi:uncharacterized protein
MQESVENIKRNIKEGEDVYFRVKVIPGSSKSELAEIMEDGTMKIRIAAQPEKGRANEELVRFLSKQFEASRGKIKIISGAGERVKLVKIIGTSQ